MSKSPGRNGSYISEVCLLGRSSGLVRSLAGFRKQHHTVPDAVNTATSGFLARLCAPELAEGAESYFQRSKAAMGYKWADQSLEVASPTAVLHANDFMLEISYELDACDPSSYTVTRTLSRLRNAHLIELAEFNTLFAGIFSAIVFRLAKGVRVEDVIDAVEAHGAKAKLSVHYPSDCSSCTISVEGIAAELVCDGATLEMKFARAASPRELIESFAAVRAAFALTRDRVLAGLL